MPKGHTNNPAGRSPGSGVVATLRREMLAGGKLEALVDKVYAAALAGDMTAARLLLDRALPALRTQAAPVHVQLDPAASLTARAEALLMAAADGQIPSCTAAELIRSLAAVASIELVDELRHRMDLLEHGDLA